MNKLCKGARCLVVVLLLVLGGLLSVSTFKSSASEKNSEIKEDEIINEEKAKVVAVDFFDKFTKQKYTDCYNMLNEKMKTIIIDAEQLENIADGWEIVDADFECVKSDKDDNVQIFKLLIHAKYCDIYCYVGIDNDYLVTSLWRNYELVPTTSEYYEESNIQVGEYKLEGLITLPKGVEKPPVAILIQGSGHNDADENINGSRPFADIAYSLARKGIATLRFNERFYENGDTFNETTSSLYEEAIDDTGAAIQMMLNDDRVDSNNIFIVGHSLGGFVAPKICELNPEVKGFVSLAGSPRKLVDISLDQWIDRVNSMNLSDEEKEKQINIVKQINNEIRNLNENSQYKEEYGYGVKYWYSANNLNTEEILNKLSIPMCIMQGSDDCQVYADRDYTEWQRILSGRDNVEFKLYNGLNHFFMKSKGYGITEMDKEYATVDHVNQQVLDDIALFINKYSK